MRIRFSALLIMSALLSGYFVFDHYYNHSDYDIPIIYPELGEAKIKPTNSGGLKLPHADSSIYDNIKTNKNRPVRLIAEPEQPIAIRPQNNVEEYSVFDNIGDIIDNVSNEPVDHKNPLPTPHNSLNIIQIKNDHALENSDTKYIQPSLNNGYKIQLASARTECEGLDIIEGLKSKHPKYFSGPVLILQKKVQNSQVFYIVLAEGYSTISQARSVCNKTGYRNNCIITK